MLCVRRSVEQGERERGRGCQDRREEKRKRVRVLDFLVRRRAPTVSADQLTHTRVDVELPTLRPML